MYANSRKSNSVSFLRNLPFIRRRRLTAVFFGSVFVFRAIKLGFFITLFIELETRHCFRFSFSGREELALSFCPRVWGNAKQIASGELSARGRLSAQLSERADGTGDEECKQLNHSSSSTTRFHSATDDNDPLKMPTKSVERRAALFQLFVTTSAELYRRGHATWKLTFVSKKSKRVRVIRKRRYKGRVHSSIIRISIFHEIIRLPSRWQCLRGQISILHTMSNTAFQWCKNTYRGSRALKRNSNVERIGDIIRREFTSGVWMVWQQSTAKILRRTCVFWFLRQRTINWSRRIIQKIFIYNTATKRIFI